jgi:hypothetical protein
MNTAYTCLRQASITQRYLLQSPARTAAHTSEVATTFVFRTKCNLCAHISSHITYVCMCVLHMYVFMRVQDGVQECDVFHIASLRKTVTSSLSTPYVGTYVRSHVCMHSSRTHTSTFVYMYYVCMYVRIYLRNNFYTFVEMYVSTVFMQ